MHTCNPPSESATGKWTCPCGERFWVKIRKGEILPVHVCRFPDVPSPGDTYFCMDCDTRYYATYETSSLSTRLGNPTLRWRRIGA